MSLNTVLKKLPKDVRLAMKDEETNKRYRRFVSKKRLEDIMKENRDDRTVAAVHGYDKKKKEIFKERISSNKNGHKVKQHWTKENLENIYDKDNWFKKNGGLQKDMSNRKPLKEHLKKLGYSEKDAEEYSDQLYHYLIDQGGVRKKKKGLGGEEQISSGVLKHFTKRGIDTDNRVRKRFARKHKKEIVGGVGLVGLGEYLGYDKEEDSV